MNGSRGPTTRDEPKSGVPKCDIDTVAPIFSSLATIEAVQAKKRTLRLVALLLIGQKCCRMSVLPERKERQYKSYAIVVMRDLIVPNSHNGQRYVDRRHSEFRQVTEPPNSDVSNESKISECLLMG